MSTVARILNIKGRDTVTTQPHRTVAEVARLLDDKGIGAVLVTSADGTLLGILSERDIVRVLGESGPAALDLAISRVMTDVVTCTTADRDLNDLMAVMTEKRIRHVPVVDEDNRLRGIVSIGDAVKSRLGELEREREALIGYITTGG